MDSVCLNPEESKPTKPKPNRPVLKPLVQLGTFRDASRDAFASEYINPPNPLYLDEKPTIDVNPTQTLSKRRLPQNASKTHPSLKKPKLAFGIKKTSAFVKRNVLEETKNSVSKSGDDIHHNQNRSVLPGEKRKINESSQPQSVAQQYEVSKSHNPYIPDKMYPGSNKPSGTYTTIPDNLPQYSDIADTNLSFSQFSPQPSFRSYPPPSHFHFQEQARIGDSNQIYPTAPLVSIGSQYPYYPGEYVQASSSTNSLTAEGDPQPSNQGMNFNHRNLSNLTIIPTRPDTCKPVLSLPKPRPAENCRNCVYSNLENVLVNENCELCPNCPILEVTLLEEMTLLAGKPVSCMLKVQGMLKEGVIKLFTRAGIISYPSCIRSFPPPNHKHPVLFSIDNSTFTMKFANHSLETTLLRRGTVVAAAQQIFLRK